MQSVIFVAKVCTLAFFGVIFVWNMIDLLSSKARGRIDSELYFEKQMWMLISLLVITIVMGNL